MVWQPAGLQKGGSLWRYVRFGTAREGGTCLHFCRWQKLRFADLKPSAATVHRTVAVRLFKSRSFQKKKDILSEAAYTGLCRLIIDFSLHPQGAQSEIYGLSHGLKSARQLSIFTPVCGLVSPFQVPPRHKKYRHTDVCLYFLVREAGLEPARPQ